MQYIFSLSAVIGLRYLFSLLSPSLYWYYHDIFYVYVSSIKLSPTLPVTNKPLNRPRHRLTTWHPQNTFTQQTISKILL